MMNETDSGVIFLYCLHRFMQDCNGALDADWSTNEST